MTVSNIFEDELDVVDIRVDTCEQVEQNRVAGP